MKTERMRNYIVVINILFNPSTLPFLHVVHIYCYIISIDMLRMSAVAEVKQKVQCCTLNPFACE